MVSSLFKKQFTVAETAGVSGTSIILPCFLHRENVHMYRNYKQGLRLGACCEKSMEEINALGGKKGHIYCKMTNL